MRLNGTGVLKVRGCVGSRALLPQLMGASVSRRLTKKVRKGGKGREGRAPTAGIGIKK